MALAEVRDLLGHSSVTMTEKYAHLAPENVRAAVAVLDGSHDLVTVVFRVANSPWTGNPCRGQAEHDDSMVVDLSSCQ